MGVMPPLYRRYVPPKPAQAAQSNAPSRAVPAPVNGGPEEKKRKRERSSDEVAQRKAKKLDRKAVNTGGSADEPSILEVTDHSSKPEEEARIVAPSHESRVNTHGTNGEFSHIKSAKKRHKLEKEARKARKATEKTVKQDPSGPELATVENEEAQDAQEQTARVTSASSLAEDDRDRPVAGPRGERESPSPGLTAAAGTLKKRRHKLESVLNSAHRTADLQDESQANEHLKKHSGVLSKFQKAIRAPPAAQNVRSAAVVDTEEIVVHDLVPLPQPAPRAPPTEPPLFSTLPGWLENPVLVPQTTAAPFADLGLDQRLVDHLSDLQLRAALPVQQAVIPLLLTPGCTGARYPAGTESIVPDLAISAPTGSGKTLAYLLPIIEQLKVAGGTGKLAALVVVPTRELVSQVAAIATSLSKGSKAVIGMATGALKLKEEQDRLLIQGYTYNRDAYQQLITQTSHRSSSHNYRDGPDLELDTIHEPISGRKQSELVFKAPPNHVPCVTSSVDLLVCTPGRLIEHLKSTPGFSLAHLRWLVLDEADKLLDEQYDGFIDLLQDSLSRPRGEDEQDARESYLRQSSRWNERDERRVRKVLLSATMTQDVSKLLALQLRRPKLLVVQDDRPEAGRTNEKHLLELPKGLTEFCVPVVSITEKPLQLVQLLEAKAIPPSFVPSASKATPAGAVDADVDDAEDCEEESSDVDSASETSDTSSPEHSSTDGSHDTSDSSSTISQESETSNVHPARAALLAESDKGVPAVLPTVLIFTSSNEAAMRLSRLLKLLRPGWAPWITTLAKPRQKVVLGKKDQPSLTICTDRAARGLDTISDRQITQVFQYDVPRSLESYVHRVGRTARAGRSGEAYTLYTHSEARWFLQQVARTPAVRRTGIVEKVEVPMADEALRKRFERALDHMRAEISG